MRIELADSPSEDLCNSVNLFLREYNKAKNPIWWDTLSDPANDDQPLNIFAYDDAGEVIGGLTGFIRLTWLRVNIMAVREDCRGQGIGSRLLESAESEAIVRGCNYVYLDTMQYQAPDFYRRLGYRDVGEIADWDSHGHAKYFFTKALKAVRGGDSA